MEVDLAARAGFSFPTTEREGLLTGQVAPDT
jgi:hypothetical protein